MIELHLVIKVSLNKSRSVIDALHVLAKNIRAVPGCLGAEVYKSVGISNCVCYVEGWESETALQKMIASHHFSQLASVMELSSEPPDCQFRFISDVQRLDYAMQVLGGASDT